MPIFDYRCKDCNTTYDILHKGKELSEDVQCPQCGSYQHSKLISLPSIFTKGTASAHCNMGECGVGNSCCRDVCPIN